MQSRKPEQRDLDYAKAVLELYDVRAAESARRARAGMFQRVGAPAQVIFVMEWLSWTDFNRWLQATFDLPREIEMGVDRRTLVRAIDANGTIAANGPIGLHSLVFVSIQLSSSSRAPQTGCRSNIRKRCCPLS